MENTQTPESSHKKIYIFAALIVLALVLVASVFIIKYYRAGGGPVTKTEDKKALEASGTLLLSMIPKEVKSGQPLTFSIDIKSKVFTPLHKYIARNEGLYIFHTSLSSDKTRFVTAGIPTDAPANKTLDNVGLYSNKFENAIANVKGTGPISLFGNVKNSRGKVLRTPSINNKGGIVYATAGPKDNTINFNWEIRYAGEGADYQVASGLSPRWISDTEFVYIAAKGLRIHDVARMSDASIDTILNKDGSPEDMVPNMMLNVSRDGKQIVLSNAESFRVFLYKKVDNRFVRNKIFSALGFWPTFSPDGKILALQTVTDIRKIKDDPNPMIEFWNIEKDVPELLPQSIDLSAYNNNMLFVTDWY